MSDEKKAWRDANAGTPRYVGTDDEGRAVYRGFAGLDAVLEPIKQCIEAGVCDAKLPGEHYPDCVHQRAMKNLQMLADFIRG